MIGYNTDDFPAFFTPTSGFPVSARLNNTEQIARMIETSIKLQLGGIVVAVPIKKEDAGDFEILEQATKRALAEAE